MKKGLKALGLVALVMTLAACDNKTSSSLSSSEGSSLTSENSTTTNPSSDSSDTSNTSNSSTSSTPVEETYHINLSVPTGVTAHLDKTEAAKGDEVTLTIDKVESGYKITKVLLKSYGEETLESSDGKTYTFTMPDRSVSITINVQVEGDITLVGDIVAALTLNPETGIYEARNVKVDVDSEMAIFGYQVKDENGQTTELDISAVDETRCFAGISYVYSSSSNPAAHSMEIPSGSTYDFFYDPAAERPCYVKRVHVDRLPNTADSLYNLFYGNIRSESPVNTDNLTAMDLTIRETSNSRYNKITMKKYADKTTYMKVEDVLGERNFYVYKHIDEAKKLYSVIDTYSTAMGSNDDTRESGRTNAAYSGRYDIIDGGESGRFERTATEAEHELNTTAHQMRLMESEIMYSYRVGVSKESVDEISYSNVSVSSVEDGDGFTTTIDTTVEYNSQEGTYTTERHEGYVYAVTLGFSGKGELTAIDYKETHYTQDQWDFTNHTPLTGQEDQGTIAKSIKGTYTYDGAMESSLPTSEFNPDDYFIQSFDKVHFYNEENGKPQDDGNNYLHYNDDVMVIGMDSDDEAEHVEVEYSPRTALDLWQYAPTKSSDESVIAQTPYNTFNEMTCVGIGDATVTLTNHTKESGIHHDVDINVSATQKFHGFALDSTSNPLVTGTTSASIYAGTTESYGVIVTPDSAPCIYEATVDPTYEDILKVESTGNHELTLSSPADSDITEPTAVRVRIASEWANTEISSLNPLYLTITVIPASYTPLGDWTSTNDNYDTDIHFTSEEYKGEFNDYYYTAPKMGTIVDNYGGAVDTYHFYYEFKHGVLSAKVYDMETTGDGFPCSVENVTLELSYSGADDTVSCCMYYAEMAEDSWDVSYFNIIGDIDEENYSYPVVFERIG